jgi:hypothetical protein
VDHPEEGTEAAVSIVGRNIAVDSRVDSVRDGVLVLRPSVGDFVEQSVVTVSDRVDVTWFSGAGHRALPAQVLSVERGEVVLWRLQVTGPAESSQRRQAVRASLVVPVQVRYGAVEAAGETVDLSEGGTRITLLPVGVPPEAGEAIGLVVDVGGESLTIKAELIRWQQTRAGNWLLSVRFLQLRESEQDRVRRRVFQALREQRAREAD